MSASPRISLPPDSLCTFAQWDYANAAPAIPHTHDFHELFWVEKGEGTHWVNGRSLPLRVGDLVLVHATDRHAFSAKAGLLRIVNFAFPARCWTYLRQRYFDGEPVFFAEPAVERRCHLLGSTQLDTIRRAAAALRSGLRNRLQVETFLLAVLALLQTDRMRLGSVSVPAWLREACAAVAVERRFAGGVPALALLAKRSPAHLAREFRRHLDRTPTDIVNDARMSYAADRLATGDEAIVTIALDCGLENLGHFYRLFHQAYRCTPRAYRLQQRNNLQPAEG